MENNKVVYLHRNPNTLEVFYVGYGSVARPGERCSRTQRWKDYVENSGDRIVEIVADNLSKRDALDLEQFIIKTIGCENLVNYSLRERGDIYKGRLVSMETREKLRKVNLGKRLSKETRIKISESNKGKTHSEESKRKISESKKGKPGNSLGRKHSKESIVKMRESRPNMVAIIYKGVKYPSIAEASRVTGNSKTTISRNSFRF